MLQVLRVVGRGVLSLILCSWSIDKTAPILTQAYPHLTLHTRQSWRVSRSISRFVAVQYRKYDEENGEVILLDYTHT